VPKLNFPYVDETVSAHYPCRISFLFGGTKFPPLIGGYTHHPHMLFWDKRSHTFYSSEASRELADFDRKHITEGA
jgi:hypothetical protein